MLIGRIVLKEQRLKDENVGGTMDIAKALVIIKGQFKKLCGFHSKCFKCENVG